jgi:hypothetical protein
LDPHRQSLPQENSSIFILSANGYQRGMAEVSGARN